MGEKDFIYKYIYALVDPRTKEARYVGQTANPKERLRLHIRGENRFTTYPEKNRWIDELIRENLVPVMVILEAIQLEDRSWGSYPLVEERERAWMFGLKALGQPILNKEVDSVVDVKELATSIRVEIDWDIDTAEAIPFDPDENWEI